MLNLALALLAAAPQTASRRPDPPPIVDCLPGPWIVFFERNSDRLDAQARAILKRVIKVDGGVCGGATFTLTGHVDRGERPAFDVRRADRVRAYLHHHGVPAARVRVVAAGDRIPRIAGPSGVAALQNRRVELTVGPP